MVHLKAAIFIFSLVLLDAVHGQPTRFADIEETDARKEVERKGPNVPLARTKRVSDQRLAELETLYALSKINLITTTDRPIYMNINPIAIGRRRRSAGNSNVHATRRIDRRAREPTINEILIR